MEKRIASIHEDVGGWYVQDADLPYSDSRGKAYRSMRDAIASLRSQAREFADAYTHYESGSSRRVRKLS